MVETFQAIAPEAHLKKINIPSEQSVDANWKLFDIICHEIEENDTIYFDITHSFRSNPTIAIAVVNYARLIYNAHFGKFLYGAFEQRDADNVVPIVDFSSIMRLLDWTSGVDQYLRTGDSGKLFEIVKEDEQSFLQENQLRMKDPMIKKERERLRRYSKLAKQMKKVDDALATVRGFSLSKQMNPDKQSCTYEIYKLNKLIAELPTPSSYQMLPLKNLLGKVKEKFANFGQDKIMDLYYAAEWSYKNGKIQQAYTFLEEGIITLFCYLNRLDDKERNQRILVSEALVRVQNKKAKLKNQMADHEAIIKKLVASMIPYQVAIQEGFGSLIESRNSINHAGMNEEQMGSQKLIQHIAKSLEKLKPIFVHAADNMKQKQGEQHD
jgi:CRISPR-associated DxTHG motif protein